jgi:hypothetical protein
VLVLVLVLKCYVDDSNKSEFDSGGN